MTDRGEADHLVVLDDPEVVHLTSFLLDTGGHIGYFVRPSRRGEGHAGRALGLALDHAADLGLRRVLLTCDRDNEASRRTIESAGGDLEDVRELTMRFGIDLVGRDRTASPSVGSAPSRP
ncbi:GNAT family N-acetyltransferase [Nocardioides sp.]|uniref:GNAT family N-acetyltransferase n=1 Tax=Nocardioides sp. TaxID=35761 RepID=UPI002B26EAF6|nr:GNAT family N-acetyltransferase [Nocardioides sp.]